MAIRKYQGLITNILMYLLHPIQLRFKHISVKYHDIGHDLDFHILIDDANSYQTVP